MKKLLAFVVFLVQVLSLLAQRNWLPQSMTAAEMWSPATWYYPHGIAASEAWTEYLKNAQDATNQLYQQFDSTGASSWIGGGGGLPIEDSKRPASPSSP